MIAEILHKPVPDFQKISDLQLKPLKCSKLNSFFKRNFALTLVWSFFVFWAGTGTAFGQIYNVPGSTQTSISGGNSVTINRPLNVQENDILIAQISQNNTSLGDDIIAGVTSSGWIQITTIEYTTDQSNETMLTLLYKFAGNAEPTSYTFSGNSSVGITMGGIVAFKGVDITNPFDVAPGSYNVTNSTTLSATSISTVTANAAILMFGGNGNDESFSNWNTTSPGSLNLLFENVNGNYFGTSTGAAWAIKSTAGNTGMGTA